MLTPDPTTRTLVLPPKALAVLGMLRRGGLNAGEIAQAAGCSKGYVRQLRGLSGRSPDAAGMLSALAERRHQARLARQRARASRDALPRYATPDRPIARSLAAVATALGIPQSAIERDRSQRRPMVRRRWLVFWLARELGAGYAAIGRRLGWNHTSILYACRRMPAVMAADPGLAQLAAELLTRLRAGGAP